MSEEEIYADLMDDKALKARLDDVVHARVKESYKRGASHPFDKLVHGRVRDIIAWAVRQPAFCADGFEESYGSIEVLAFVEITPSLVDELKRRELLRRKHELERELARVTEDLNK